MAQKVTNTLMLVHAMERAEAGPIMQVFIIAALDNYSKAVQKAKPGFLGDAMISEDAWKACAEELQSLLDNRDQIDVRGLVELLINDED